VGITNLFNNKKCWICNLFWVNNSMDIDNINELYYQHKNKLLNEQSENAEDTQNTEKLYMLNFWNPISLSGEEGALHAAVPHSKLLQIIDYCMKKSMIIQIFELTTPKEWKEFVAKNPSRKFLENSPV